jgi:hypothetical protein
VRLLVATQPAEGGREPADLEEAWDARLHVREFDRAAEMWLGIAITPCEAEGVSECHGRLSVRLATVLRGERPRLGRGLEREIALPDAHQCVNGIGGGGDSRAWIRLLQQRDGFDDGCGGSIAVAREELDRALQAERLGSKAGIRGTGERLSHET